MPLVGVVTSYPAISSKLNPGFSRVRIAQSALVFCVLFCGSLLVFLTFHVAITLLVLLRITASNYPGIFNLFCGDIIASERKLSLSSKYLILNLKQNEVYIDCCTDKTDGSTAQQFFELEVMGFVFTFGRLKVVHLISLILYLFSWYNDLIWFAIFL